MATDDKNKAAPASGAASTEKAKEEAQKQSLATGAPNPMLPDDRNFSTPTADVSPLNTVGNPSPGTESQRQWAAATTITAESGDGNPSKQKPAPESKGEPIESVVVKRHQNDEGALLEVGSTVYYQPREDRPYPWPLLRPKDDKFAADLEDEYLDFMDAKDAEMAKRGATDDLIRRIADRS